MSVERRKCTTFSASWQSGWRTSTNCGVPWEPTQTVSGDKTRPKRPSLPVVQFRSVGGIPLLFVLALCGCVLCELKESKWKPLLFNNLLCSVNYIEQLTCHTQFALVPSRKHAVRMALQYLCARSAHGLSAADFFFFFSCFMLVVKVTCLKVLCWNWRINSSSWLYIVWYASS